MSPSLAPCPPLIPHPMSPPAPMSPLGRAPVLSLTGQLATKLSSTHKWTGDLALQLPWALLLFCWATATWPGDGSVVSLWSSSTVKASSEVLCLEAARISRGGGVQQVCQQKGANHIATARFAKKQSLPRKWTAAERHGWGVYDRTLTRLHTFTHTHTHTHTHTLAAHPCFVSKTVFYLVKIFCLPFGLQPDLGTVRGGIKEIWDSTWLILDRAQAFRLWQ